jgi:hypothetical protein
MPTTQQQRPLERLVGRRPQLAPKLGARQTLALHWQPVPKTLPPNPDGHRFSPDVWLALSDGTVKRGNCLHRDADATYPDPVHSWFVDGSQLDERLSVVAWMPLAVPDHPLALPAPRPTKPNAELSGGAAKE